MQKKCEKVSCSGVGVVGPKVSFSEEKSIKRGYLSEVRVIPLIPKSVF